jgi:FkbM family methyltransferase
MIPIDIPKLMRLFPRFLRRHSLIKAILRLSPDSASQRISFNNHAYAWVDLGDPEARNVFLTRSFEPDFFSIIAPWIRDRGVFFDCGANFGLCTFGLAAGIAQSNVEYHLFEANPRLIPYLQRSIASHAGRFYLNHGCLADKRGISHLNFSLESSGQSHISSSGTEINNIVLDDYITSNSIKRISVIKIDIEGAEPLAMRGLQRTLARGAIDVIYIEVLAENLHRMGFTPGDVVQQLRQAGFKLFYCRYGDYKRIAQACWKKVTISGKDLLLAPMYGQEQEFSTDLLAVYHGSDFYHILNEL